LSNDDDDDDDDDGDDASQSNDDNDDVDAGDDVQDDKSDDNSTKESEENVDKSIVDNVEDNDNNEQSDSDDEQQQQQQEEEEEEPKQQAQQVDDEISSETGVKESKANVSVDNETSHVVDEMPEIADVAVVDEHWSSDAAAVFAAHCDATTLASLAVVVECAPFATSGSKPPPSAVDVNGGCRVFFFVVRVADDCRL
jgi:flagellar biosynthesis/type III secretory pathway M-ring protein FliF/YscJ